MNKDTTGKIGEKLAAEYLINQGYKIIGRNVKVARKEIDIIAEDDFSLVIVEVKTRNMKKGEYSRFGRPSSRVDRDKQSYLLEAANRYVASSGSDKSPRIDVIEVYLSEPPGEQIVHIRSAVQRKFN
jgi:putative endonuclease